MEGETKQIKNFIYDTADQIGKGFSSIVYKGTNLTSKTPVAIKVIDLKSIKTDVEKMLLRNQMKALRVIQHQNILQVIDIYQTGNNAYIVSQLCTSGDLTAFYTKSGGVMEADILKVFMGVVKGVEHCVSKGIIHRDLKPANILLKGGVPKIIDFGFCDIKGEKEETKMKFNVGSPLYMSPEAYKTSNYSEKSDVWALGVILYEMLIGKTPFKGIDYDTMVKNVASGDIFKQIESGYMKMLLSRMLSIDTQRRADIKEIVTLLNQPQGTKTNNTLVKRPSGQYCHGKSESEIKLKRNFSLKKEIGQQASPRKVQPIIFPQPQPHKPISTIQTINTQRMNKLQPLNPYLIFIYRVCKITRNLSSKSTFMQRIHHLTLSKLKACLELPQFRPPIQQFEKISKFTKESLDNFNICTYSNDLYFTSICTTTLMDSWFSETVSDFMIFWVRIILSQLYQEFSRVKQGFETFQTQKFEAYLYLNEFQKILKKMRGKKVGGLGETVGELGLSRLLEEKKAMTREAIKVINNEVRLIVESK